MNRGVVGIVGVLLAALTLYVVPALAQSPTSDQYGTTTTTTTTTTQTTTTTDNGGVAPAGASGTTPTTTTTPDDTDTTTDDDGGVAPSGGSGGPNDTGDNGGVGPAGTGGTPKDTSVKSVESGGSGSLPFTGFSLIIIVIAGLALIGGGVAIRVMQRRGNDGAAA